MGSDKKRCMVCGKETEMSKTICPSCNESIKGEAVGKQKKIVKNAEKQMKRHG